MRTVTCLVNESNQSAHGLFIGGPRSSGMQVCDAVGAIIQITVGFGVVGLLGLLLWVAHT